MNTLSLDRGIDFFIAYLAKHADELSVDVATDRSAYQLVESQRKGRSEVSLSIKIPVDTDIDLLASTYFPKEFDLAELDRLAEDFADRLTRFERFRSEMAEDVTEFRSHALKAFRKLPKKSPLKFVSLDLLLEPSQAEAACVLSYEMLGDNAKPMVSTLEVTDCSDIDNEISFRRDNQSVLASRAKEVEQEAADGAVDAVLVARLESQSMSPLDVIKLGEDLGPLNDAHRFDDDSILFWKEGILTLGFPLNDTIRYHGGHVTVRKCPKGFSGDVAGRKVSELIDHPAIPDDLLFASGVAKPGEHCNLIVALQYSLFCLDSGEIW